MEEGSVMSEEWRTVPGYGGRYSVSSEGRAMKDGRAHRGALNQKGYRQISLSEDGKRSLVYLHRAVLAAFVGPMPEGHQVDHRNAVKDDNRLANLRYVTPMENVRLAHQMGLIPLGEDSFAHRLTWPQVREIRRLYRPGGGYRWLAEKFECAKTTIEAIITRHTWKHDPMEAL